MIKLPCIIIEDEPLLAEVLSDYIRQVPQLELMEIFHDPITALDYLKSNSIELVFIDINLPKIKGIDFIKLVTGSAKFIITTAYQEYALQGYELNVVDYLMKPVEFNRFLQAVKKALDNVTAQTTPVNSEKEKEHLFVTINKKRTKIDYAEILYVEGMKEYIKIHTTKGKCLITKLQMNEVQELLSDDFLRIHRSYIVSKKKIAAYNLSEVSVGVISLPVGTNYRDTLTHLIES